MKPHYKLRLDGTMRRCSTKPRFRLLTDGSRRLTSVTWTWSCGQRLYKERRRLAEMRVTRLSPTVAASLAGTTPQHWRDMEAGRACPTGDGLRALERMGVNVGYVLGLGARLHFSES